jgi:putative lipoic acid-binding regulatory protein
MDTDTSEEKISTSCTGKPEIAYPCLWMYTIIGKDPESIRNAIITACSPAPVQISLSHTSSRGKYWSFNAELEVEDESKRLSIFQSLTNHPAIKFVL